MDPDKTIDNLREIINKSKEIADMFYKAKDDVELRYDFKISDWRQPKDYRINIDSSFTSTIISYYSIHKDDGGVEPTLNISYNCGTGWSNSESGHISVPAKLYNMTKNEIYFECYNIWENIMKEDLEYCKKLDKEKRRDKWLKAKEIFNKYKDEFEEVQN